MSIFSRIENQKKFNTAISSQIETLLPSIDVDLFKSPYTNSDISEIFTNFKNCAEILEVREYEDHAKIHNANFCNNPHVCAVCASRVSGRRQKMFKYIPEKLSGKKYRLSIQEAAENHTNAYMLTATVKNGPVLSDQIQLLQSSIRSLQRMGQKRKDGRSRGEWGKVKAAIGNVENKRGKGLNEWHSHIHFLIFSDDKLDYRVYNEDLKKEIIENAKKEHRTATKEELFKAANKTVLHTDICGDTVHVPVSKLSEEWFFASGGSTNISCEPLDIFPRIHSGMDSKRKQRLTKLTKKIKELGLNRAQSIAYQSEEIFKYSTKFDGKDFRNHASDFVEVLAASKNRRLFRTYGSFRARGDNEGTDYIEGELETAKAVYSVSFDRKTGFYGDCKEEHRTVFSSSDSPDKMKRFLLGETAKVQGAYRKTRNEFLNSRSDITKDFDFPLQALNFIETKLDDMKDKFRMQCREIWAEYARFFQKRHNEELSILV